MTNEDIDTPKIWLTTSDLAKRWQMAEITIRHWRLKGSGPRWTKLGQSVNSPIRYRLADIERYEAESFEVEEVATAPQNAKPV
jgi:hypothetical protein